MTAVDYFSLVLGIPVTLCLLAVCVAVGRDFLRQCAKEFRLEGEAERRRQAQKLWSQELAKRQLEALENEPGYRFIKK